MKLLATPSTPGQMGGSLEALQMIFTDGVSASSLAVSIAAWLDNRRKAKGKAKDAAADAVTMDVVIQRGETRVSVSGATVEEIQALLDREDGAAP